MQQPCLDGSAAAFEGAVPLDDVRHASAHLDQWHPENDGRQPHVSAVAASQRVDPGRQSAEIILQSPDFATGVSTIDIERLERHTS